MHGPSTTASAPGHQGSVSTLPGFATAITRLLRFFPRATRGASLLSPLLRASIRRSFHRSLKEQCLNTFRCYYRSSEACSSLPRATKGQFLLSPLLLASTLRCYYRSSEASSSLPRAAKGQSLLSPLLRASALTCYHRVVKGTVPQHVQVVLPVIRGVISSCSDHQRRLPTLATAASTYTPGFSHGSSEEYSSSLPRTHRAESLLYPVLRTSGVLPGSQEENMASIDIANATAPMGTAISVAPLPLHRPLLGSPPAWSPLLSAFARAIALCLYSG